MNCKFRAHFIFAIYAVVIIANAIGLNRFEKRVNLRKFKGYVTEVQMYADELHGEHGETA